MTRILDREKLKLTSVSEQSGAFLGALRVVVSLIPHCEMILSC